MIDDELRYKTGLTSYILIFFVINIFITLFLQMIFFNIYNVDTSIYNEIIQSKDMLIYLSESYTDTVYSHTINIILLMSAVNNLVVYIILFIMCGVVFKKDLILDLKELQSNYKFSSFVIQLIKYLLVYYAFILIFGMIINLLNILFKVDSSTNQQTIVEILNVAPLFMVISAGFLGPIVEELIFRKSIFGIVKDEKKALIISTLSFALIHIISSIGTGYNIIQMIILTLPYISGGLIFGLIYLKSNKNIYFVILIHIIANIISILLV